MPTLKKFFITAPFIFLFLTSSFAQNLKEQLDKYIIEYRKAKNIPSISAGVLLHGKIFWVGATGYSDLENFILANPKTVYRIASISKPITAVAIMQLVEKRKIKLDDDVRKYVPYFPPKKWKFTIRELLNHTSGIRNYKTSEEFNSTAHYNSIQDAVSVVANDPLLFKPGTKFLYTTLGYNLLAAVIEKASGLSYNNYLKKFIFEPLGMTTIYSDVQTEIIHHRARGYIKDDYRELENAPLADLSIKYPGGGLIAAPEDILKFANGLITGKLIKHATLDTMLQPTKLANGKMISYGLGISSGSIDGEYFFSHAGNGTGFSSFLVIFPKSEIAAVCFTNVEDRNLENPAMQLALHMMKRPFQMPEISLPDSLFNLTLRTNIDSAISYFRDLARDSTNLIKIKKEDLFLFGSDLMNVKRSEDAVKFYRVLAVHYPEDPQTFLSLANAYYSDGNKGLALKNYWNVLRFDPGNSSAQRMVEKLRKE